MRRNCKELIVLQRIIETAQITFLFKAFHYILEILICGISKVKSLQTYSIWSLCPNSSICASFDHGCTFQFRFKLLILNQTFFYLIWHLLNHWSSSILDDGNVEKIEHRTMYNGGYRGWVGRSTFRNPVRTLALPNSVVVQMEVLLV